jgi:hypothetical protein
VDGFFISPLHPPFPQVVSTTDMSVIKSPKRSAAANLRTIYAGHALTTVQLEIIVETNGDEHELVGRSVRMVDLSMPVVELLTPECTPHNQVLKPDAMDLFNQAADDLVLKGITFVTALRKNWAHPNILWQKK